MHVQRTNQRRTTKVLLSILLVFCLISGVTVFEASLLRAEEAEQPTGENVQPTDGEDPIQEPPQPSDDYTPPAPAYEAVISVDWSQFGDNEKPQSIYVTISPDGNHLYSTSFELAEANDWTHIYPMPAGTQTAVFSIDGTNAYNVNDDGNGNFVITMLPPSTVTSQNQYIDDVNIDPGEENANIPYPTANNDVPADAVLKIRSKENNNDKKETVEFEMDDTKLKEAEAELKKIEEEQSRGTNMFYVIAAVAAAVLALILIILRIVYAFKNRRRQQQAPPPRNRRPGPPRRR